MQLTFEQFQEVLAAHYGTYAAGPSNVRFGAKQSAVLIPIVEMDSSYYLLMTKRSEGQRAPGMMVCPGGKTEWREERNDPIKAAIRECKEEIDLDPVDVRVLGILKNGAGEPLTYFTADGYQITPVVGMVNKEALGKLKADPREVARITLFPIEEIINSIHANNTGIFDRESRNSFLKKVERSDGEIEYQKRMEGLDDKYTYSDVIHPRFSLTDWFEAITGKSQESGQIYQIQSQHAAILLDLFSQFKDVSALRSFLNEARKPPPINELGSEKVLSEPSKLSWLTRSPAKQNRGAIDENEAAALIDYAVRKGDEIRNTIFEMRKWNPYEYHEKCHVPALNALEEISRRGKYFNFASVFRVRANDPRTRDKPFLTFANKEHPGGFESVTYVRAEYHANQIRRMLLAHGLDNGSKIATMCYSPGNIVALIAALGIGDIVAPLHTGYESTDLLPRLKLTGAEAIVITPDQLDKVLDVRKDLGHTLKIFVIERDEHGNRLYFGEKDKLLSRLSQYDDVYPFIDNAERYAGDNLPLKKVNQSDPAIIMMTSGSSGELKEVLIPHSYALASYVTSASLWGINGYATAPEHNTATKKGFDPVDSVYCTAPLGWMYGVRALTIAALAGAEYYGLKTPGEKRDIRLLVEFMYKCNVTVLCGIPSLLRQFAQEVEVIERVPDKLRRIISTGEPILLETRHHMRDLFAIEPANSYAATEAGHTIATPEFRRKILPDDVVGIPLPGIQMNLSQGYKQDAIIVPPYELFKIHFEIEKSGESLIIRNDDKVFYVTPVDNGFSVIHDTGLEMEFLEQDEMLKVDDREPGLHLTRKANGDFIIQKGGVNVTITGDMKIKSLDRNSETIERYRTITIGSKETRSTALGLSLGINGASGEYRFAPDHLGETREDDSLFLDIYTGTRFRKMNDSVEFHPDFPLVVHYLVRTDDLIKRYAIQIYPAEIEKQFADALPERRVNIALGIPDKDKNSLVVSYIELPLGGDEKLDTRYLTAKVAQATSKMSDAKKPDFVIIAPVSYERDSNKVPVKAIKRAVTTLVKQLQLKDISGGIFMVNGLRFPLEGVSPEKLEELAQNNLTTLKERKKDEEYISVNALSSRDSARDRNGNKIY